MKFRKTALEGVCIIEPQVIQDERGHFFESYNQRSYQKENIPEVFIQDNHSFSEKGVIRGLHYQRKPKAQAKLVRVSRGQILDVAVDIRPQSKTFGHWVGEVLSGENNRMMFIPDGFAHGFCALEPSDVLYKVSKHYSPEHSSGILWSDPKIGIQWPSVDGGYILSKQDQNNPDLEQAKKAGRLS